MEKSLYFVATLLLFVPFDVQANEATEACKDNEKSLTVLDLIKETIIKIKDLFLECGSSKTSNKCFCDQTQRSNAYTEVAINLINSAKERYLKCVPVGNDSVDTSSLPMDCVDILRSGQMTSGVYTVWLYSKFTGRIPLHVYCDMETDGGGWTVIQRRGNFSLPSVNFYRDWNTYKTGFGNAVGEFWIGNDNIFLLSNQDEYQARFDMEDVKGDRKHAVYDYFRIEGEEAMYKLHILDFKGDAGDSMKAHNQMLFSTKDIRNDKSNRSEEGCALSRKSGWWFDRCTTCNPNGLYLPGKTVQNFECVYWYHFKNSTECLKSFEIKLRRM